MLIDEFNFPLCILALAASDEVAIDTETTGLNVRNKVDYLMGLSVSVEGFEGYLPFRHKERNQPRHLFDQLIEVVKHKDLIWHNRKFDMHSLATMGIDPLIFTGKQYDTMILAQLVNEEWYSKELNFLSKKLLHKEKYKPDELHGWAKVFGYENLTPEMTAEYGTQDAVLTRLLKEYLWPRIVEQELEGPYQTEEDFTRILYKMECRGVGVNREFAQRMATLGDNRMSTIVREVGFNPGSPLALAEYLLEGLNLPVLAHTDSCVDCKRGRPLDDHEGKPSFNKVAMQGYDEILQESKDPTARLVAEYRGWLKAVSSLYKPLLEKVGPDGLIRTDYRQCGTVTGRISSASPNLQQIPRSTDKPWNGSAKSAFTAGREGYTLIGWDYSQLELRLAAAYGDEPLLLQEFAKPDSDVFSVLAPLVFGVLTPETRHKVKNCFVYPNLYGAGLRKIHATLGLKDLNETERLYANYKSSIPGIMAVSKQVTSLVEQRHYVRYWDGRRRHIRDRREAYKAFNSVAQGGAAQLVKQAQIRCEAFEDENCFQVMQVHDEITFCIRTDRIEHYRPMIEKAMTDWPQFNVNLAVDSKVWK